MSAPTAATLRAVARRAERLAEQIGVLAELLAADPDLDAHCEGLPEAAAEVHEAALRVLAAADALPRRRPRPRPTPQTAGSVSGSTDPAPVPVLDRHGGRGNLVTGAAPSLLETAVEHRSQTTQPGGRREGPSAGPSTESVPRAVVAGARPDRAAVSIPPTPPGGGAAARFATTGTGPSSLGSGVRWSAAMSAPSSLEPAPCPAVLVCPPPVLHSRGRAALASLRRLAERAAYEAAFACGRAIRWLCRRLPALPECAGLEWR